MSILKLPRTIRLDPSDTFVFRKAATAGEWAVTGTFLFADAQPDTLDAKARAAFRSGFLGVGSFGWSTLAVVTPASEQERDELIMMLAAQLVEHCGAPNLALAIAAAKEEITFAASLCDHPPQTLLALNRGIENGELFERFRTLTPRGDRPKAGLMDGFRAFEIVDDESTEGGIEEHVDLLQLGKTAGIAIKKSKFAKGGVS